MSIMRPPAAGPPGGPGQGDGPATDRLRLFESVVVNAHDAVLITQAEPFDSSGPRIIYCNAAFTRMTGYTEAEVLGRNPRLLQSGKTDRATLDTLRDALGRWEAIEVQLLNRRKDGSEFWVELSIVPVANADGWFTHWISVQRDITDRKAAEQVAARARASEEANRVLQAEIGERRRVEAQLESKVAERTRALSDANASLRAEAAERTRIAEALRQAQKMEAVGQLTGGLAHDFNNLLTGISGSLELIRIRTAQGRTAELERYVAAALTSTDRAAALTHRLLAFSRRQTLDPRPININSLVTGLEELLRRTVGPAIDIESRLVPALWPLMCDPNQFENALMNLVINGRDAMAYGGRLVIETANIVFPEPNGAPSAPSAMKPEVGEFVSLSVTDTGSGMTPEVMARAFDPFFTTKPMGQGTGLGLSMTYGFVQQSGGCLHLRSEEGLGTTVTIYLPRHDGPVEGETTTDTGAAPQVAGATVILLVEDEAAVRMVVIDLLTDLGYTVLVAVNGPEGLTIIQSCRRIDLLITDIGLPGGMNGRELAAAARARRPELKVLFVTGYAETVVGDARPTDPTVQIMTKPFGIDAFTARVRGMISG